MQYSISLLSLDVTQISNMELYVKGCFFACICCPTGTEKTQGMQALAISPNWRYLAVSERGERCTITVYDLQHEQSRKRKVLTGGDVSVPEFVCMAFSPDSKYLLGQGGGPEWTLIYWLWEKNKVIATVKSTNSGPVYQVKILECPEDKSQSESNSEDVMLLIRASLSVLLKVL